MFHATIPENMTGFERAAMDEAARKGVELVVLRTKRTFTNQPNLVKTYYLCFDEGANPAVYNSLDAMRADNFGQGFQAEEGADPMMDEFDREIIGLLNGEL